MSPDTLASPVSATGGLTGRPGVADRLPGEGMTGSRQALLLPSWFVEEGEDAPRFVTAYSCD